MKITLEDIRHAREAISGLVRKTPLEHSISASNELGSPIYFKCENLQLTGSFKIRGALNKISSLTADEKKRGVIAASAGNHAQGVALSSKKLGVDSVVVMPKNSSIVKQIATRNYGAEVILHGEVYDDAYAYAKELEKKSGRVFIHPYEDEKVIAGQGTIGLEIFEDLKDVSSVIVPIGGGGIISGVALALKNLNPKIKIYGVVAENAPGMKTLFKNEMLTIDPSYVSIADGIAVKKPSVAMHEHFISKYVDDVTSVSEDNIAEAISFILERAKLVTEGSAAVTLAAAFKREWRLGEKCVCLLSGGNIDLNLVGEILDRGLSIKGRIGHISVVATDKPGTLSRLTKIIGDLGANILDVKHDRILPMLQIRETMISFVLETKNAEHIEELKRAITEAGFRIV